MRDILARCVTILLLSAALVPTSALAANDSNTPAKSSPATPNKTQDLVCWGSGPDWSIQFGSWGARYVGVNQPDKSFRGHFYWAPADKSWVWQERTSDLLQWPPQSLGRDSRVGLHRSCPAQNLPLLGAGESAGRATR